MPVGRDKMGGRTDKSGKISGSLVSPPDFDKGPGVTLRRREVSFSRYLFGS